MQSRDGAERVGRGKKQKKKLVHQAWAIASVCFRPGPNWWLACFLSVVVYIWTILFKFCTLWWACHKCGQSKQQIQIAMIVPGASFNQRLCPSPPDRFAISAIWLLRRIAHAQLYIVSTHHLRSPLLNALISDSFRMCWCQWMFPYRLLSLHRLISFTPNDAKCLKTNSISDKSTQISALGSKARARRSLGFFLPHHQNRSTKAHARYGGADAWRALRACGMTLFS